MSIAGKRRELFVFLVFVLAFLVEGEEAVEFHHGAGSAQFKRTPGYVGVDVDRRALKLCRFHLAGDRAQPNQLVEFGLIRIEEAFGFARSAGEIGWTNGLVRFLRVLRLSLVPARRGRHIIRAVIGFDHTAGGGNRFGRDLHAVGAHIGNQTDGFAADVDALIEPLRDPHGVSGRKAELAACFLLQRRGCEGRLRMPLDRFRLDRTDGKCGGFQGLLESFGFGAGADIETLEFLAVGADETGIEGLVARRRQRRDQRPIFLADEFFDFQFAVADKSQRDRLHASG